MTITPPWRGPLIALALVAPGWWTMVLVNPSGSYVAIGFLLGTLFGQTTLAAAWTAFGPLPWYGRLPLALSWVTILWFGVVLNIAVHGGPREIPVALAASLLGQWFLVQLPLWGLALGYRLRLAHGTLTTGNGQPPPLQFGIRQLMTLTAIVGVLLGLSRALIVILASRAGNFTHGEAFIFMYLATVAVIMTLPLVMAALLPRRPIIASLIVVALIGIATAWELPLLSLLPGIPSGRGGPSFSHFVLINAFTAAWILAIIAILRRNGYGLVAQFR